MPIKSDDTVRPVAITPWTEHELTNTMLPDPAWAEIPGSRWGTDPLAPLAGDEVMLPDGTVGYAMHSSASRPRLPDGGQHRFVLTDAHDDPALPLLAYHVSQLRPAPALPVPDLSAEITAWDAAHVGERAGPPPGVVAALATEHVAAEMSVHRMPSRVTPGGNIVHGSSTTADHVRGDRHDRRANPSRIITRLTPGRTLPAHSKLLVFHFRSKEYTTIPSPAESVELARFDLSTRDIPYVVPCPMDPREWFGYERADNLRCRQGRCARRGRERDRSRS